LALFIGTSGWDYKEWKGAFYPSDLPESRFLEHYGRELTACEVNVTFYHLQSEPTLVKWGASVPEGFRFAVKAHRRLSHRKRIAPPDDFLERFLASLAPLRERLACILLQYPPYTERDDHALGRLLAALPAHPPFAFEFRHPSWAGAEVEHVLAEHNGTVCLSETEGAVPERLPPGRFAYVRLRASSYEEAARGAWLELLREEARTRDVYAFAKHKDVPAGDPFTGVGLAQWLNSRSSASRRPGLE
jgi:uncharacterized protein YecE (DUF72 family)